MADEGKLPGFLARLIRTDLPEDPKRLTLVFSAAGLTIGFLGMAFSAAHWIWVKGDLGGGAVGAIASTATFLAGLAGYAHTKPDAPSN